MRTYIQTIEEAGPNPLGTRRTEAVTEVSEGATVRQTLETDALIAELRKRTTAEVRFDRGSRALYATDGSNYRQQPIGVVIPRTMEDVIETVAIAREFDAPLLSRGGGTSLAGQCCNAAIVIDFTKYLHKVIGVDREKRKGTVQPGCVLDDLRDAASEYGLTFGPDPATHTHCTLGGMVGNDSCGIHAVMAQFEGGGARTADNISELEVLTYDGARFRVGPTSDAELDRIIKAGGRQGEIYAKMRDLRDKYADEIRRRYPKIPRRVSGYNLDELLPEKGFNVARALVGSEGTLVTVLEVVTDLIHNPPVRSLLVLGYPDSYAAGDHVTEVMAHQPTGCEGIDHKLIGYYEEKGTHVRDLALMPPGNGFLLVEFGGESKEESDAKARKLMAELKKKPDAPSMKLYDNPAQEEMIWKVREGGLGATAFVPGKPWTWPGWEDSAVPSDCVGKYLRALRDLFHKYGYDASLYGHFGQGCIHCRVNFDLVTHDGIATYRKFLDEAADLVVSFGGSLSGEHGDGQARAELLPRMFGEEIVRAFEEFKAIWDPKNRMNPGKVVYPYKITENLRLGPDFSPRRPDTYFQFPMDEHNIVNAALRCVGVGKCRREEGGTMCPSYMVTREEQHCTRGRAHLMFEMLTGDLLKDGWQEESVKEALDLCLACKGCTGQCPVNVDVPTFKAEFLAHYYEGHPRPRSAYAFGFIQNWSRLASRVPELVNFVTQTPGLSHLAKFAANIAPDRKVPEFAAEPFQTWFAGRERRNLDKPLVLLWPDTFNNYFHPTTAQAAVEVLEDAGFQVTVPRTHICCGRPLYDFGFLESAKRYLERIMEVLKPEIDGGIPIVVLEPSCATVFKDELKNLFPSEERAKRLHSQVYLLSEFLVKHDYKPPKLKRKALVHGHCHHKAVLKMDDENQLLDAMGLTVDEPPTGCCGMAGAFGFEAGEHADVADRCGERVLLPAVRNAERDTLIVADGFSCREQIRQHTDREGLHLAQVLQMALKEGEHGAPGIFPEKAYVHESEEVRVRSAFRTAAYIGGAALLLGGALLGIGRAMKGKE